MAVDHEKLVARVQHFYEHLQNVYHFESEEALKSELPKIVTNHDFIKVIEAFIDEFEDIFSDCIYFE